MEAGHGGQMDRVNLSTGRQAWVLGSSLYRSALALISRPSRTRPFGPLPPRSRSTTWLVGLILLQLIARVLLASQASSATTDELFDVATGHLLLRTGDMPFGRAHAPLPKVISALPLLPLNLPVSPDPAALERILADPFPDRHLEFFGRLFFFAGPYPPEALLFLSRAPGAFWLAMGGLLIFSWARALGGERAGLLALGLYGLEPNLIAHAQVATSDVPLTVMGVASLYLAWRYQQEGRLRLMLGMGVCLGLTVATKISGLMLLPLVQGLLLCAPGPGGRARGLLLLPLAAFGAVLPYGPTNLDALWAGVVDAFQISRFGRNAFLMGEYSSRGWLHYFAVAALIKTPLPSQLVVVAGAGAGLRLLSQGPRGPEASPLSRVLLAFQPWRGLSWPLLAAGLYFGVVSVARADIGLRYLLPAYPLVYLAAAVWLSRAWSWADYARGWTDLEPGLGPAAAGRHLGDRAKAEEERFAAAGAPPGTPLLGSRGHRRAGRRVLAQLALCGLMGWLAVESCRYHPHYIPYFNQLVGGPAGGWRYLSDSNLDWGQGLYALRDYVKAQGIHHLYLSYFGAHVPEALGLHIQSLPDWLRPGQPLPLETPRELLAISVMNRQGVLRRNHRLYQWLDTRPVLAMPGWSIHLFDITGDVDAHLELAKAYAARGRKELAAWEHRKAALWAAQKGVDLPPEAESLPALLSQEPTEEPWLPLSPRIRMYGLDQPRTSEPRAAGALGGADVREAGGTGP